MIVYLRKDYVISATHRFVHDVNAALALRHRRTLVTVWANPRAVLHFILNVAIKRMESISVYSRTPSK